MLHTGNTLVQSWTIKADLQKNLARPRKFMFYRGGTHPYSECCLKKAVWKQSSNRSKMLKTLLSHSRLIQPADLWGACKCKAQGACHSLVSS